MAINGGAFTQDFRTQLRKYSDGTTRVGEEGRLWYNNSDQTLRVSDGSTAGGVVINSGGGGGSSITIQDEGSSLSTAATTINFVGSGVTASGTGATKTITISGGGGGVSDIVDDTSPQLGGDLDINGKNIVSAVSNENINIVPNGTGKLVLAGDFLPSATTTFNLGSADFRWNDLFLSGDTINLAGSTISSDGTGTISISADGVTLPNNSKNASGSAFGITSSLNGVEQAIVLVPFFTAAGGLSTANTTFTFNGTVENKPVFIGDKTFTLENGSAFSNVEPTLFQF